MSKYRIKKHCHKWPEYDYYTIERKWLCFWIKVDKLDCWNTDDFDNNWNSFEKAKSVLNQILVEKETHTEIIKTERYDKVNRHA